MHNLRSLREAFALLVAIALALPAVAGAQSAPSPAPPAASAADPVIPYKPFDGGARWRPVYVIATGGDAATRAKFVSVLTARLQRPLKELGTTLFPQPGWVLSDYIAACQNTPQYVAGALIAQIGSVSSINSSFFLLSRSVRTRIQAGLLYSRCEQPSPTHTPSPSPTTYTGGSTVTRTKTSATMTTTVTSNDVPTPPQTPLPRYYLAWNSGLHEVEGTPVTTNTPLTALAFLVTLAAGVMSVFPQRTRQATTTTNFPTPQPFQTVPAQGVVASQADMTSTTANPSQLGAVSAAFLTSSLAYAGSVQQIQTSDEQTLNAINDALDDLLPELGCPYYKANIKKVVHGFEQCPLAHQSTVRWWSR